MSKKVVSLAQLSVAIVLMSKKMFFIRTVEGFAVKIYDYNGSRNICGQRIYEARTCSRMTQSDLAARLQTKGVKATPRKCPFDSKKGSRPKKSIEIPFKISAYAH